MGNLTKPRPDFNAQADPKVLPIKCDKDLLADTGRTAVPLVAGNGGVLTLTDSTATGNQRSKHGTIRYALKFSPDDTILSP
jgi:hypothetical protein